MKNYAASALTLAAFLALTWGSSPAAEARAGDLSRAGLQSDHPRMHRDLDDSDPAPDRSVTREKPDVHENVAAAPELSPGAALSATAVLLGGAAILAAMRRTSGGSGTPLDPRRRP